jgi:DoxX-like family
MNILKIFYWIFTILVSAFFLYSAYLGLSGNAMILESMKTLGYPPYFSNFLSVAKILGVITLLFNKITFLKEWAYAGFIFVLIGAMYSHLMTKMSFESIIMPISILGITIISYILWKRNEVNFLFE